jgi:putative tricarboxylic transport membrane protein
MSSAEIKTSGNFASVNFNTVIALSLVALGATLFLIIPQQVEQPLRLIGETTSDLDPSIFPKLVAGLVSCVGILLFFVSFKLDEHNDLGDIDGQMLIRVCVSLVLITSYAFLLQPMGFVIASALIVGTLSTYYGNRSIIAGTVVSVLIPLFMFNLFTKVLKVSLPPFPLDLGITFI